MSKKETIEDRVKALAEREEKIKKQLDNDSDDMKDRVIRIGKIAAVTGLVALVGYWIFNIFSDEEDEDEVQTKEPRKRSNAPSTTSRLAAVALPYLNKFLEGVLMEEDEENKEEASQS